MCVKKIWHSIVSNILLFLFETECPFILQYLTALCRERSVLVPKPSNLCQGGVPCHRITTKSTSVLNILINNGVWLKTVPLMSLKANLKKNIKADLKTWSRHRAKRTIRRDGPLCPSLYTFNCWFRLILLPYGSLKCS